MKLEKLPSGTWRIRPYINGKRTSITFDHKPTQKEIAAAISDREDIVSNDTFECCAREYIRVKSNVLSPSTIRGYEQILRNLEPFILKAHISEITQLELQKMVNNCAVDHSPKTTKNYYNFVSAVLKMYAPNKTFNITFPAKQKKELYIPSQEDIQAILEYNKDSKYYIPLKLACYGLRRSEICALEPSDLKGNNLTINKVKVQNNDNEWVIKHTTKTEASTRVIVIDDDLADRIRNCDHIFQEHPNKILRRLTRTQNELGIEHFSLHKMRHYFASQLSSKGMDDATIMSLGGWETDNVMKTIYRHSMDEKKKAKIVSNLLFD